MIEFILQLLLGSLWCYGIYAVFDNDHLLGPLGDWIESNTSTTFIRPLFGCPPCMASFHGGVLGFVMFGLTWTVLPYMICLCGLNYIIKNIIFHD